MVHWTNGPMVIDHCSGAYGNDGDGLIKSDGGGGENGDGNDGS